MIRHARTVAAVCLLLAACETLVGFDYRVVSKDPKVSSAQMLSVVSEALDRAEAKAWAQIDEKTGEIIFTLGAFGSGKPPSVRTAEARLLGALRYKFGERVEAFCNGEPLR